MTYLFQTTKAGTLHTPQLPALKFFLQTALLPVGSAMYVWGGGWNESDTGAEREACTLGVSPRWKEFAQKQTASYNYRTTRYQIHDGLDCSGYVGWCIYNLFHTAHSSVGSAVSCGYVMPARRMAAEFAARGWGTFIPRSQITAYHAGDIMSSRGHVWIAVGQCDDGSIVLLHSSPPGVRLCGTPGIGHAFNSRHPSDTCRTPGSSRIPPTPDITDSQAIRLAGYYMRTYYPDWYSRYPDCSCDSSYLRDYDQMRWDTSGKAALTDSEGFQKMSASTVLKNLFHNKTPFS